MATKTALAIVNQSIQELGLQSVSSLTSANATERQYLAILNASGIDLINSYTWQELDKEFTMVTNGTNTAPLPTDFNGFIDQTQWDTDIRWPLIGPMSPQQWQFMKNSVINSGPYTRYRILGNKLTFYPIPAAGLTYRMEYKSTSWVQSGAGYATSVTLDSDIPVFDAFLIERTFKLKLWEAKGLDTTNLLQDAARAFIYVTGADTGAPVLNVAGRAGNFLLGYQNVPDGSWSMYP